MTEEMNIGNEVGNVVWFDQKKGFGFVKIVNPGSEFLNNEIFIHFSSINSESNFKKLYPGENVSLDVERNEGDETKKFLGKNVTGLFGTKLLVDNETYSLKVLRKRQVFSHDGNGAEPEPEQGTEDQ
jgi:cold shock CspA family protein